MRLTVKLSDLSTDDSLRSEEEKKVSECFTWKRLMIFNRPLLYSILSHRATIFHFYPRNPDKTFFPSSLTPTQTIRDLIWLSTRWFCSSSRCVFFCTSTMLSRRKRAEKRRERSRINWSKIILIKSCIERAMGRRLLKREIGRDRI